METSDEQSSIIEAIRQGLNVRVIAVPGSGKTTTVLMLSRHLGASTRVLVLTYNRELMLETRIKGIGLKHLDIHTIHSFIGTHYSIDCSSFSSLLTNFIGGHGSQRVDRNHPQYGVIIVDEAQDLNNQRVLAICRIIRECSTPRTRLLIMGDPHQCVYEWQGASSKFLMNPESYFQPYRFVDRQLSVSFRLTQQVANFASNLVQGDTSMISTLRSGPDIVRINCWNVSEIYNMIAEFLRQGYRYDDIFILSHSIKPSKGIRPTPLHYLEHKLVSENIPILRPICGDETSVLKNEDMLNRVVISTFASSKGRERKIVFVMSWTAKYFVLTNQQQDCVDGKINPYTLPNSVYVAITRTRERLILCESKEPPPWESQIFIHHKLKERRIISVSQCIERLQQRDTTIDKLVDSCFVRSPLTGTLANIQSHVKDVFGRPSPISDITGTVMGIAVELYYFKRDTPSIHVGEPLSTYSPADLIELSLKFEAIQSRFNNRHIQIQDHSWITEDMVKIAVNNFGIHNHDPINESERFEVSIEAEIPDTKMIIHGRLDCVTSDSVWEFKCVNRLSLTHKLQLLFYEWITKKLNRSHMSHHFKLINLKTGELLTSKGDMLVIESIIDLVRPTFQP